MNLNMKYLGRENRATVKEAISIKGVGVHSGESVELKLIPAPAGTGLVFRATGSKMGNIPVNPFNVISTQQAVTLGNGNWQVSTVEHVLCALAVAGVTDLYFEINAPEMPIMDGSALPFYEAIMATGVQELNVPIKPITLKNPIWVVEEGKYIVALPADSFRTTYSIDFDHPQLRGQNLNMELTEENCVNELMSARTFGFYRDLDKFKEAGLAKGASLDNTVVLSDDSFMNQSLRFDDECVRHKVLDLIGDLYLISRPLQAHIIAYKAGHTLDVALGRNILTAVAMDELAQRREVETPALAAHV